MQRFTRLLWLCLLEARPAVQGIFFLRFVTGAAFAGSLLSSVVDLSFWVAAGIWTCAMLCVYILNGIMDAEEDRINLSKRPVARGELTIAWAATVAAVLATLAVVGSLALGESLSRNVVAVLALGWLYSGPPLYLKRWPAGLALVAIVGGLLTYTSGYTANGGGDDVFPFLLFVAMMSLWMGLVGQTKDLSDVEGDERAGRRSGPVAWGENAARLAVSGMALCLGAAFVLLAASFAPNLLKSAFAVLVGALALAIITLGPWSRGDRSRSRRPYRAFMLTQYAAHLAVLA